MVNLKRAEMRSFIAIELPDELKRELSQLEAQLKSGDLHGVKWVDPKSIHLTLKFLGDVGVGRLNDITRAMEASVEGISPFRLQVRELGVFPSLKRVRVVWVGIGGEIDKVGQLQQRIESNLAALRFAPEPRRFTPHLTLARVRDQASPVERQRLAQLIAETTFESACGIEVKAVSLMRSQLTREGAIYSLINSVRLD
jgi:2'-5' RNA ligase